MGEGGLAGNQEVSGIILSITCAPQLKRGVRVARPCRKKCSGGLRYWCALALSGGRAGCLVPQQPPTPSAEVDGVLLWKHGYT